MSHYKLAILYTNQRVDQVPEGEENEESCHLRYREFLDQDRRCGRESMASSQQHANEKDEDRHMVSYLGTSRQTIYKNMTNIARRPILAGTSCIPYLRKSAI